MQQKPKKALRGLFTRTEPAVRMDKSEPVTHVEESLVSATPMAPIAKPESVLPAPASTPPARVGASASKAEASSVPPKPQAKPSKIASSEKQITSSESVVETTAEPTPTPPIDVTSHPEVVRANSEQRSPQSEVPMTVESTTPLSAESIASSLEALPFMAEVASAPPLLEVAAPRAEVQAPSPSTPDVAEEPNTDAKVSQAVEAADDTLLPDVAEMSEPSKALALEQVLGVELTAGKPIAVAPMIADEQSDAGMPLFTVLPFEQGAASYATSASYEETLPMPQASRSSEGEIVDPSSLVSFVAPRFGAEGAATSAVEALGNVVRGFNATAVDRSAWHEDEYLAYLRRIDQAQTEAFLLKGKLLEEVKRRFFEDSKTGWKRFCEDRLDMNYTTANQYIRVAEEFESVAKERPDFGFEHFKALLPLPADQRGEILARAESLSVKTLRKLVQEKLTPSLSAAQTQSTQEAKSLVRSLEQLKDQILGGDFGSLPQLQRWQLAAACQNLSDELGALAAVLNRSSREAGSRSASHAPRMFEERPGASIAGAAARDVDSNL